MPTIPTFTRQQTPGGTSGVRPLPAVQIDDSFERSLQAASQTLGQIGGQLIQAQAESEVSTATVNAQLKLAQLEAKIEAEDGLAAPATFQTEAARIYGEASSAVSTPQGRKAFDQKWNGLQAQSQIAVTAAGLKRKQAALKGDLVTNLDSLSRGVELLGGGRSQAINRRNADTTAKSAIDAAVKSKAISPAEGAKLYIKFRSDLAKAGIDEMMLHAGIEELASMSDQMAAENFKGDPENGIPANPELERLWADLTDTERLAKRRSVETAHERKLNILEKREVTDVAKLKRNQGIQYGKFMKNIIAARREDEGAQAPTKSQLLDALASGGIDSKQYEQLEAALLNQEPVHVDHTVVRNFLKEIRDADSAAELETIIESAENAYGATLDWNSFTLIETRARAAGANTPEKRRIDSYSNAMDKMVKSLDFIDKLLPGAGARAAVVQLDFEARIADGMDPAKAFVSAVESFRTRGTVDLNSIPRPQFGPDKKLNEWTLEEAEAARDQTKLEFRGKPNVLATQLLILQSLTAYLQAQRAATQVDPTPEGEVTIQDQLDAARSGDVEVGN